MVVRRERDDGFSHRATRRTEFGLRGAATANLTGGDSSTGIAAVLFHPNLLLEPAAEERRTRWGLKGW